MSNNYIFKRESSLDHYEAEAFVVRCFDDRFWKVFKDFLKSLGLKHIDPESVAGGAKIFASPEKESDRDFMTHELEKSIKLHHTKKVMLFTHHDCGAYGGSTKFNNNESTEFDFHASELKKAMAWVKEKFPNIGSQIFFIDDRGVVEIV